MEVAFAFRLLAACGVIGLVLAGVHYGARLVTHTPPAGRRNSRLLAVVETTFLPGAASLHVIRVAGRHYVVGRSGTHIAALCEIQAEDIAARHSRPATTGGATVDGARLDRATLDAKHEPGASGSGAASGDERHRALRGFFARLHGSLG